MTARPFDFAHVEALAAGDDRPGPRRRGGDALAANDRNGKPRRAKPAPSRCAGGPVGAPVDSLELSGKRPRQGQFRGFSAV